MFSNPAPSLLPKFLSGLGVIALIAVLFPCLSVAADDWVEILSDANISQSGSTYDAILYGSNTTLSWNDADGDENFDDTETLVGSAVVSSSAGTLVSPANLTKDELELWAQGNAEEIYRIIFPGGISQAFGSTEEAIMSSSSVSNQLKKVSPKEKKAVEENNSEFKAAVEYHKQEANKVDGDAFSLVLGYSHLFNKSEFGFLIPYRYTTFDDNIDSKSQFVGLEFYGSTALIKSEGFTWSIGADIFGSLYYLTSDAIEHLGQVKYGAGVFTVVDKDLPIGQISAAVDYKISEAYLPDSLSDTDNVFVEKGIEYVNDLDTVHTITYGVNYGVALLDDNMGVNVEVLRSHFNSDDIEGDRDTRTTATIAVSYYPTDTFELTLGVNKVFEVADYDDFGFTFGTIFRF